MPKESIQKMIETKQRNFKYKVTGKKIYLIRGRNGSNLISSLDKDYLEDFIPLLNSNEEAGLKAIEEAKFNYKYEIVKVGFNLDGKRIYGLKRNGKIVKTSINRAEIFSAYSKYLY